MLITIQQFNNTNIIYLIIQILKTVISTISNLIFIILYRNSFILEFEISNIKTIINKKIKKIKRQKNIVKIKKKRIQTILKKIKIKNKK